MGQEYNDVTTDVITKMVSNSGTNLTIDQLKSLRDALELTLSRYNIEEDITKTEILNIQEENAEVLRDFINAKRIEEDQIQLFIIMQKK